MAKKDTPGIYGIHCTVNDKWYVGASKQTTRRIKDHQRDMKLDRELFIKNGERHDFRYKGEMGRDYAKFGASGFEFFLLEVVKDLSELENRERAWVAKFNAHSCGYNCQAVGRNRHWGKS